MVNQWQKSINLATYGARSIITEEYNIHELMNLDMEGQQIIYAPENYVYRVLDFSYYIGDMSTNGASSGATSIYAYQVYGLYMDGLGENEWYSWKSSIIKFGVQVAYNEAVYGCISGLYGTHAKIYPDDQVGTLDTAAYNYRNAVLSTMITEEEPLLLTGSVPSGVTLEDGNHDEDALVLWLEKIKVV